MMQQEQILFFSICQFTNSQQITGCTKVMRESSLVLIQHGAASYQQDMMEQGYWSLTVYAMGYTDHYN